MAARRRGERSTESRLHGQDPTRLPRVGVTAPRPPRVLRGGMPMVSSQHPGFPVQWERGCDPGVSPCRGVKPNVQPKAILSSFLQCSPPPQGLTPSAPIPRAGGENSPPGSNFQPSSPRFSASARSITWRLPNIHLGTFLTEEVVNSLFNTALQPSCRPWVGFSRLPGVCKSFGSCRAPSFLRGTVSGAERRVCPETSRKRADREADLFSLLFIFLKTFF